MVALRVEVAEVAALEREANTAANRRVDERDIGEGHQLIDLEGPEVVES